VFCPFFEFRSRFSSISDRLPEEKILLISHATAVGNFDRLQFRGAAGGRREGSVKIEDNPGAPVCCPSAAHGRVGLPSLDPQGRPSTPSSSLRPICRARSLVCHHI
jgi:hypothetical protein